MKRAVLAGLLIGMLALGSAQTQDQNLDTVIITSSDNYPDTYISEPASETIGAPVLITDGEQLSGSVSNTLDRVGAEEAILVGGPEVLSESVESSVSDRVNSVTRLWGTTQIGTSVEVSEYFWPESTGVTIVQYDQSSEDGYRLLSRVSGGSSNPVLISKTGTLSASVLSEVERLGATDVEVYSTNAVNVTQDLEEIGVEEVEVEEESLEQLSESEGDETDSRTVIVAATNFRHAISSSSSRGSAVLVGNQDQISSAVNAARDSSRDTVYVTGEPELAGQIAERVRNETDKQVELVTGEADEVSSNFTEKMESEWSQAQQQRLGDWRQNIRNSPGLQKSANRTLNKAEGVIDSNSSSEARQLLQDARDAYESEDYFEARENAIKAYSTARSENFRRMSPEEVAETVEEEREDLREAMDELRELGQEQAEELRNAETTEERLEIIREYREERREELEELRENRRESLEDSIEQRQRDRNTGERFRQEPGDPEDVGNSELKLEVEGNEVKARAEYTGSTAGYTSNTQFSREGSTVTFNLELESPEGAAAQVVTDYRLEKREELENGNYTVEARLRVDGDQVSTIQRQVEVPGMAEFETESADEESGSGDQQEDNVVRYTDSGFEPSEITVEQGEDVTWIDESNNPMWVASDQHPSHTQYDGTSLNQHCEDGESDTFDQCSEGEEYEYRFEKAGTWEYHNHEFAAHGGTVVVE